MNNLYVEISNLMKSILTPDQIIKALPLLLNVAQVVANKGEGRLSQESALFIQTEIEKLRLTYL